MVVTENERRENTIKNASQVLRGIKEPVDCKSRIREEGFNAIIQKNPSNSNNYKTEPTQKKLKKEGLKANTINTARPR